MNKKVFAYFLMAMFVFIGLLGCSITNTTVDLETTTPTTDEEVFTTNPISTTITTQEEDLTTSSFTTNQSTTEELNYYSVIFEEGMGTFVYDQEVLEGAFLEQPFTYCNGYIFDGWYLDEDLTVLFDFSSPVTSDLTLYSKWHSEVVHIILHVNSMTYYGIIPYGSTINDWIDSESDVYRFFLYSDGVYLDNFLETPIDYDMPLETNIELYMLIFREYPITITLNFPYASIPDYELHMFVGEEIGDYRFTIESYIHYHTDLEETFDNVYSDGSLDESLYSVMMFEDATVVATTKDIDMTYTTLVSIDGYFETMTFENRWLELSISNVEAYIYSMFHYYSISNIELYEDSAMTIPFTGARYESATVYVKFDLVDDNQITIHVLDEDEDITFNLYTTEDNTVIKNLITGYLRAILGYESPIVTYIFLDEEKTDVFDQETDSLSGVTDLYVLIDYVEPFIVTYHFNLEGVPDLYVYNVSDYYFLDMILIEKHLFFYGYSLPLYTFSIYEDENHTQLLTDSEDYIRSNVTYYLIVIEAFPKNATINFSDTSIPDLEVIFYYENVYIASYGGRYFSSQRLYEGDSIDSQIQYYLLENYGITNYQIFIDSEMTSPFTGIVYDNMELTVKIIE